MALGRTNTHAFSPNNNRTGEPALMSSTNNMQEHVQPSKELKKCLNMQPACDDVDD
jgi:hypothetical protein